MIFELGNRLASCFGVLVDDLCSVVGFGVGVGDDFVKDAGLVGSFVEKVGSLLDQVLATQGFAEFLVVGSTVSHLVVFILIKRISFLEIF